MEINVRYPMHAGVLMMDISKAFDTVNHELLIAKLYLYMALTGNLYY